MNKVYPVDEYDPPKDEGMSHHRKWNTSCPRTHEEDSSENSYSDDDMANSGLNRREPLGSN